VRYKIPAIPFYLASLFIIKHLYDKEQLEDEESEVEEVVE
jgi:hypothetical protein